jgi:hypothetical protein
MRASDKRATAAQGIQTGEFYSHLDPRVPDSLWPSIIDGEIQITKLPKMDTSAAREAALIARGAVVQELPIPLYRAGVYFGTPRRLDNQDWLKGKEPVYGSFEVLEDIRSSLIPIIKKWRSECESSTSLVASMEMQDLEKITAQQWKPTAWFLASPVTAAEVPRIISPLGRKALRTVCRRYARVLARDGFLSKSLKELTLLDSDPPDTMTGAPTWTGGPGITHAARLAALRAFPAPSWDDPVGWAAQVRMLDAQLGVPASVSYSPVVSTRQGPMKKPVTLWVRDDYGYHAQYEAKGLYSRTRFVYPAPYPINFLLSPIYELCSTARKRIPGLWHDPESQANYEKLLQKQGRHPYSIDFSGMDTGMWPHIIQLIISELLLAGFPKFPLGAFSELYKTMSVLYPSFYGQADMVTALSGPVRPWCSGFKLTSEFDTLYGAAVLLSALECQLPGTIEKWDRGEFVFGELGDDIILTLPSEVDDEKFASDALRMWGAKLEIIHDALFLKWMLPITPEVKTKAKPFSRFVQQTFFNEDRYSGAAGGDKPGAVLRIGLIARMEGLTAHPWFARWWSDILPVVLKLQYVKEADPAFIRSLEAGRVPSLTAADVADILAYGTRQPEYFAQIAEQADFRQSAAQLKATLESYGITELTASDGAAIRTLYWDAFVANPTAADIQKLRTYVPR